MWLRQIAASLAAFSQVSLTLAADLDCLFVDGATLSATWPPNSTREIAPKDLNAIHQVARGEGVVILLRSFADKKDDELDSEEFWKLTVELPKTLPGRSYAFESTATNTRYSRAGSAWAESGFGYIGTRVSGKISVHRLDSDTMTMDLAISGELRFAGDPQESQPFVFNKKATLRRLAFENLTPWLGMSAVGAFDHWVTHRPSDQAKGCSEPQ